MKGATVVLLGVVAGLAAVGAILAGTNTVLAVPVGAVAVGVAALLLLSVLERTAWPSASSRSYPRSPSSSVRAAFRTGKIGRHELISLLDSLEHNSYGTVRSTVSPEELGRLLTATPEEFRRYLEARVRDLEGRT